jgi:hypothetical protein
MLGGENGKDGYSQGAPRRSGSGGTACPPKPWHRSGRLEVGLVDPAQRDCPLWR